MKKYSTLVREDGRKITNLTVGRVGSKIGNYTIEGIDLASRARDTLYILTCDICSKDKELFPYGSIVSNWGNLNKGQVPCGCSSSYGGYSEYQSEILIKRKCEELDYTFNGWIGG